MGSSASKNIKPASRVKDLIDDEGHNITLSATGKDRTTVDTSNKTVRVGSSKSDSRTHESSCDLPTLRSQSAPKHGRVGVASDQIVTTALQAGGMPKELSISNTSTSSCNNTADNEDKIQKMEKQMAELDQCNLDLLDQVQSLEQQVLYLQNSEMIREQQLTNDAANNTANAQHTARLQQELTESQQQLIKLKQQCRKKLRQLNSKLTDEKQTSSVKMFEYRDDINRLTEENTRLTDKLRRLQNGVDRGDTPECRTTSGSDDTDHMRLVVELSSRVSEQDIRIMELENIVRQRDTQIAEMSKPTELTKKTRKHTAQNSPVVIPGHTYGRSRTADDGLEAQSSVTGGASINRQNVTAASTARYNSSGTDLSEQLENKRSRSKTSKVTTTDTSHTSPLRGTDVPTTMNTILVNEDGWDSDTDLTPNKTQTVRQDHTDVDPANIRKVSAPVKSTQKKRAALRANNEETDYRKLPEFTSKYDGEHTHERRDSIDDILYGRSVPTRESVTPISLIST